MAQVYLEPGDKYKIVNDNVQVFGQDELEQIIIDSGVNNLKIDQNIEKIDFAGDVTDFTFMQEGNQLLVFDKEGNKICELVVQGDVDGTELGFTDGAVEAALNHDTHAIELGGVAVPTDIPGTVDLSNIILLGLTADQNGSLTTGADLGNILG